MSEHPKDEPTLPTIPDRLPGEAELSELYRENVEHTDEQPSVVIDQLILNEACKAIQPPSHLRLISRRWTVPLTLAAGLLVSIGVMTMLQDNIAIERSKSDWSQANTKRRNPGPVSQSGRLESQVDVDSSESSDFSSSAAKASQTSKYVGFGVLRKQEAAKRVQKSEAAQIPESLRLAELSAQLLDSPEEVPTDSLLSNPTPAQRSKPSRALGLVLPVSPSSPQAQAGHRTSERKTASDRRLLPIFQTPYNCHLYAAQNAWGSLPTFATGPALRKDACSANVWLHEVIELNQAGRRIEAEASYEFFRKRYPRFDNFPDNFPQELLDKVSAEAGSDER